MNQMQPVAKRDNLYTLSPFALKLWLFRLKYKLILGKHTHEQRPQVFLALAGQANPPQTADLYLGNSPCFRGNHVGVETPKVSPGLADALPPGRAKLAKAHPRD